MLIAMDKSANLDDLCRLCGELEPQIISVFSDEGRRLCLQEKIESNVKVLVSENDDLPKGVCTNCHETLSHFSYFVDQCQETQEKLQEFLAIQQSMWMVDPIADQPDGTSDYEDSHDISHNLDIPISQSEDGIPDGNIVSTIPSTFISSVDKDGTLLEKDITQSMEIQQLLQEQQVDGNSLLRFPSVEPGSPFACALEDSTVLSVDAAAVLKGRGLIRFQRTASGVKIVFPPSASTDTVSFTDLMKLFTLPEVKGMFASSQDKEKAPSPVPSPPSPPSPPASVCDSWSWEISQLLDMEEEMEKDKAERRGRAMTPLEVAIPDEQSIGGVASSLSLFEDWNLGISPVLDLDPNVATVGVVAEQPPQTKQVSIEFIVPKDGDHKWKRPPTDPADEHITEISPTEFKCQICDETFRWRYKCQRHVRSHTGEKPYICGVCGKSFTVKYYLSRHLKSHDASTRLKCRTCGKSVSRPHLLKEHEDSHKGPPTLECASCSKKFHSKAGFEQHACSRAQPRLVCDICGGTFAGSVALRHHRVRHEAARFRCPLCPAMYHTRYELDRHTRRHKRAPTATVTNPRILPTNQT